MRRLKLLQVLVASCAAVCIATAAQAATLLSNLGNTTIGDYVGAPDSADHFTTGSQGLNVTGIQIKWEIVGTTPLANRVGIYTENANYPSTTLVGSFFTNPNPTTPGIMTYSGNATLAATTTYWVVVDISDKSRVAYTTDNSFVADASTGGAVILAGSAPGDNEISDWAPDPANLQYAIIGTAAGSEVPTIPFLGLLAMIGLIALAAALHLRNQARES